MYRKVKKSFFLLSIIFFIFFVVSHYFSEENITRSNRIRSIYLDKFDKNLIELLLLKNDTSMYIEYRNNMETLQNDKIKKRKFWNLIAD